MKEIKLKEGLVELTHKCNLACTHCFLNKKEEDLSKKEYFDIFLKLKNLGIRDITLMGGEPTLNNYFYEILDYCLNIFKNVTVETNGTTKTEFHKYPSCKIAISLEHPEKERNDKIRKFAKGKKSHFEWALRKIRTLTNPKIIRFTLYQDSNVFKSLVLADMYGCNSIFFPLIPLGCGEEMSNKCPDSKKIAETLRIIEEFNKKSKYHHELSQPQTYIYNTDLYLKFAKMFKERGGICQAGKRRIYVSVKGDIFPCPFVPVKLGNILKDNITFIKKEIYRFNIKMKKKKPKFPCSDCFFYPVCNGGCTAYHFKKDYKLQDNCPVNFLIKKYRRCIR